MIYRFRAILDASEDVLRDIEIESTDSLEDLHNVVLQSFGLEGNQMASFYLSDEEWAQGEEISLFNMSEGHSRDRIMSKVSLEDVLDKNKRNLIYVYDFFSMWTFLIELADIAAPQDGEAYPRVIFNLGVLPDSPPDKKFEGENLHEESDDYMDENEDEDYYDEEGFDDYQDY